MSARILRCDKCNLTFVMHDSNKEVICPHCGKCAVTPILDVEKDELRRDLNRDYAKSQRDKTRVRKFGAKKYKSPSDS